MGSAAAFSSNMRDRRRRAGLDLGREYGIIVFYQKVKGEKSYIFLIPGMGFINEIREHTPHPYVG